MSRSRTPQLLRGLAAETSDAYGCRAGATHEGGGAWLMQWTDGPTELDMRARIAAVAPEVEVDLRRAYSPRAWTLAALRACLSGQVDRFGLDGVQLARQVEVELREIDAPDQPRDGEQLVAALAERHLDRVEEGAAVSEERLLQSLATEGPAALLTPRQAKLDASDVLTMSPAQHLTARYARGEDAWAWRMRLRTLAVSDLVAAASADEDLDRVGRLAVLGLLEEMRRLWEATEAAAFAAARDVEAPGGQASWSQIGDVLGISRQGAQDRGKRRAAGGSSRLS